MASTLSRLGLVAVLSLSLPTAVQGKRCSATKFESQGCFVANDNGQAVLSGDSYVHDGMKLGACAAFCAKSNFEYFAVQDRRVCSCGDSLAAGSTVDASQCVGPDRKGLKVYAVHVRPSLSSSASVSASASSTDSSTTTVDTLTNASSSTTDTTTTATATTDATTTDTATTTDSMTTDTTTTATDTATTTDSATTDTATTTDTTTTDTATTTDSTTTDTATTGTATTTDSTTTDTTTTADTTTSTTSVTTDTTTTDTTTTDTTTTATTTSDTTTADTTTSTTAASTATSTIPASTTAPPTTTTSTPYCDPTPTWAPENCWVDMPTACASLNRTPTLPGPLVSMTASACSSAFSVNGALATAVAGCFANIGRQQFAPLSAYSCVSAADVYCTSTTASCDPSATPTPVVGNGDFEAGAVGPWVQSIFSTAGNYVGSVSNEKPHSGRNSFKLEFNNQDGGQLKLTQNIKIFPGKNYEMSYWWYSGSSTTAYTTQLLAQFPGRSIYLNIPFRADSRALNTWYRESLTFTPPASFATLTLSFSANKAESKVVMYFDDVAIVEIP